MIRVEDGEAVARWSSLVDPGIPIPAQIQAITGITDAMTHGAPSFAALAGELRRLLAGAVFVAHNARFDYGFVRNALRRCGDDFEADVLCTVKLSRALYPQQRRHGLDALIDRHGLVCTARHRAMGDAEALADFLRVIAGAFPATQLAAAVAVAMKRPRQAPALADGMLESLPASAGVYLLYGKPRPAAAALLYVGSSRDLRSRVASHLTAADGDRRLSGLARQVADLEFIETAGELGAALLASQLVAARRPPHNRVTDRSAVLGLELRRQRRRAPVLARVPLHGSDPLGWPGKIFGIFRGPREIDHALRGLAERHRLCPVRLGVDPLSADPGTCRRSGDCSGVCAEGESPAAHDHRLAAALACLRLAPWPWRGAIVIRESSADGMRHASHVLDHWCLLGTADDENRLDELLSERPARAFDLDQYRILRRWLASAAHRAAVIPID